MQDVYPLLRWEKERSACGPTDLTVIFRGYSTQHLQMYIISGDQVEYYMNHIETEGGIEEVFILFSKHENRFSLPTMGNIFFMFLMHCKVFLANQVVEVE